MVPEKSQLLAFAQSSTFPVDLSSRVSMSLENLALRSLAEVDESTARAVRELLRLKAKVIELTPIPRGELRDDCLLTLPRHTVLRAGDADRQSEMLVRGRGMVPEEAWRLIPVVDEAVSSIVELERRRCVRERE